MNQFLISSHEGLLDYETTRWKGQFSLEILMRYFIIYPLRSTTTKGTYTVLQLPREITHRTRC